MKSSYSKIPSLKMYFVFVYFKYINYVSTYICNSFSKFSSAIQSRIFWTYIEDKCILMFYSISCSVATVKWQQ